MDFLMPLLDLLREFYPIFCLPIIVFLLLLLVLSRMKRNRMVEELEEEKRELRVSAWNNERLYKDELALLGRDKNQALLDITSLAHKLEAARDQGRKQEEHLNQAIKDRDQLTSDYRRQEKQLSRIVKDKERLSSEMEKLRKEKGEALSQNREQKIQLSRAIKDTEKLSSEVENLRQEKDEIISHYRTQEAQFSRIVKDKEKLSSEMEKIKKEKGEALSHSREQQVQLNRAIEDKEQLSSEAENLRREKDEFLKRYQTSIDTIRNEVSLLAEQNTLLKEANEKLQCEKESHATSLKQLLSSNLEAIPWLAGMMGDYLTYDLEVLAKQLDWGSSVERMKKVKSIREIRQEAKARIAEAKVAVYELEYAKTLFPALEDVLDTDYKELNLKGTLPEHDTVRDYLSREEWSQLTERERNQLALNRYIESSHKSKWQIGRDYELSVGYYYSKQGCEVDTFGSYMKLEDLGRDLIVKKEDQVRIVQCKYWSQSKEIHEKHLFQLYGTVVAYCIENRLCQDKVKGVFVTNITLSPMARQCAERLGIIVKERFSLKDYPRIKCNIGRDELGYSTKIYHLPMDQQYDTVKISKPGECFAFTVEEAEDKGFRRAFRWHSS